MMLAIRIIAAAIAIAAPVSAFADAACEKNAKTRDDFLNCSRIDTDRILVDSHKLYVSVRKLATGDKQAALDVNYRLWDKKLKSDCSMIAYSFNDWGSDYTPDTDFQVSACRMKIAEQQLEFYKSLTCPGDMETSRVPTCEAINKALSVGK
ncbi:hypothetical protein RI103_29780 [Paraburkholderia sp. FT54]|uniref:hypothetical protein n=1 Tax=Paraburkholderia sp. FT54 TaxID=3074437 RepID=UPI002877B21B|nr:hypothetical protein [Paraburkholderia sp. FT54]WNC92456.1 hypothetical protein RI103_29780 [Paraburkholderia sp. FT54]